MHRQDETQISSNNSRREALTSFLSFFFFLLFELDRGWSVFFRAILYCSECLAIVRTSFVGVVSCQTRFWSFRSDLNESEREREKTERHGEEKKLEEPFEMKTYWERKKERRGKKREIDRGQDIMNKCVHATSNTVPFVCSTWVSISAETRSTYSIGKCRTFVVGHSLCIETRTKSFFRLSRPHPRIPVRLRASLPDWVLMAIRRKSLPVRVDSANDSSYFTIHRSKPCKCRLDFAAYWMTMIVSS